MKLNKNLFLILIILFLKNISTTESITLTKRQVCDLELILNGGFTPLDGFMDQNNYNSVVENMRLSDGKLWPIPIVLDVNQKELDKIKNSQEIDLRTAEGIVLAKLKIKDIYKPDKIKEAQNVYGTTDTTHPGVYYLINQTKEYYISGKVTKVSMPKYYDFTDIRLTPAELKKYFKDNNIDKVVAFQTRNPMHRAHVELTHRAAAQIGAHLLIHPVVGLTKPGDVDYFTRVKCYKKILKHFPQNSVTLSLLPLSMRMAGPREAVWHAIIRKNYGCTHFIVGRDHAGPGKDKNGKDFYDPYDAQNLVKKYAKEIRIEVVPFKEMVYLENEKIYKPIDEVSPDTKVLNISGTQLRNLLQNGEPIPEWFTYPEVALELQKSYPPKQKQGITIFFTGLSGSGKSTLANALAVKLTEIQDKCITILDGDIIRTYLSSELGFSKEHRSLNVRRVGFVASEISKNGGIAICCLIAPYEQDRTHNRNLVKEHGQYIEIYVSTPLDTCMERDVKGLYAQAQQGLIANFTGISDPYEVPQNPELTIDTTSKSIDDALNIILKYLVDKKLLNSI